MKKFPVTRREMLASMAIGSSAAMIGAATNVVADEHEIPSLGPEEVREFHEGLLNMTHDVLGDTPALSPDGLMQSLAALQQEVLINDSDFAGIRNLISRIVANTENSIDDIDGWSSSIRDFYDYDNVVQGLQDVAKTIVEICMSSVEYAVKMYRMLDLDLDLDIVRVAVAHDVRGAMDGALSGAKLANSLRLPGRQFAVYGAVIGATTCSVIGYFDYITNENNMQ